MKHEETDDITTLLVEATDERVAILRWLGQQRNTRKVVVLVLPEQASRVFRHVSDLRDLRRQQEQNNIDLKLVIAGAAGNERLRVWARRLGFPVFASAEMCARVLGQPATLALTSHVQRKPVYESARPAHGRASVPPVLHADVLHQVHEEKNIVCERSEQAQIVAREGRDPIDDSTGNFPFPRSDSGLSLSRWGATAGSQPVRTKTPSRIINHVYPVESPVTLAIHQSTEYSERLSYAASLASVVPSPQDTEPLALKRQRSRSQRLLLVLMILLVLSILGGIGFGYLMVIH